MPYFYVLRNATQRSFLLLFLSVIFGALTTSAQKFATTTGDWSNPATWNPVGVPGPGDAVSINSGVTVTVDVNASAASVQINNSSSAAPASLVFGAGQQLTVSGFVSLGATNGEAGILDMSSGGTLSADGFSVEPLSAGNQWIPGTGSVLLNGNNTLPALFNNFYNLTVQGGVPGNSRTTTAGAALAISNSLTIASQSFLNMATFPLSFSGGVTLDNGGTVQTQNTSSSPLPTGQSWGDVVAGTGAVEYNATGGGQTVVSGSYNNLYLTHGVGSAASTAGGDIEIGGQIATLTTSTILDMGAFQVSSNPLGGIGAQTNVGTIRTQYIGADPLTDLAIPSGRTWGGTVEFNATNAGQKVVFGTYNNLTVLGNGETESSSIVVNGNLVTGAGTTLDMNQETLTGTFDATGHAGNLVVRGTTPFPAGKTFGGLVTYDGTVAQTVRTGNYNDLSITTFRSFDLTLESGTIAVAGDLLFSSVVENGAVFVTTGNTFEFNGTGPQNITVTAMQTGPSLDFAFNGFRLNGSGLKTLLSPVQVGGLFTLTDGVLATSAVNLLTLNDGATVSGGSTASYVQGPMRRIGTTAFLFPLGGSDVYAPLGISAPGAGGDYTARYIRSNPQALGTTMQAPVVKVSGCEYWNLVKNGGTVDPSVTLTWSAESGCNGPGAYISNTATLLVVRFNGAAWESAGNAGTTGNTIAGTIDSDPMSAYDNITLGSSGAENLLPLRFISVSGALRNGAVDLRWTTASEFNVARFEVLRSNDGRNFQPAGVQVPAGRTGAGNYSATDRQPLAAAAYYRIQAVDADGRLTLSPVIRVRAGVADAQLELYPVPVRNGQLSLRSDNLAAGSYELRVIDAAGRVLMQSSIQHSGGAISRPVTLPQGSAAGRYQLILMGSGEPISLPFTVQ
ncbi:MAG: hypothetical protein EOO15_07420 [Chitinophagaceae bacterium]|nr:MAG: hypothetical protein EOO15_07420 [Chitinophagaceae bacterium]